MLKMLVHMRSFYIVYPSVALNNHSIQKSVFLFITRQQIYTHASDIY